MSEQPAQPSEPKPNTPPADEPPAWARQLLERFDRVEGKASELGKDFAKLRKVVKDPGATPDPEDKAKGNDTPPSAGAITRDELEASRKLGAIQSRLPEKARDRLEKMLADGSSYSETLKLAAFLDEVGIQSPSGGVTPPPPGRPETGAPAKAQRFETWKEWQEFKKQDPDGALEYMSRHDGFTPSKLKGGPNHRR